VIAEGLAGLAHTVVDLQLLPGNPRRGDVDAVARSLERPGDLVADFYGGSGTTLIACQQADRAARVMELDPRYVDVICRRFQQATGVKPILQATGEPHDFTGVN
jgi:hypothetical protein